MLQVNIEQGNPTTKTPLVSVVMSVYNETSQFLEQAMNSLLQQTLPNFEIVLIDDGSNSHETIDAIDRWAKTETKVRLIRHSNIGLTKSLNLGISAAHGIWIARQDSDDWSDIHRLEKQMEAAARDENIVLIGSWFYLVDANGNLLELCKMPETDEMLRKIVPRKNPFCHGAMTFRREAAVAIKGYREFLYAGQDYDFFWRLIDLQGKFAVAKEALYFLRNNPKSISATKGHLQKEAGWIIRKLGEKRKLGLDNAKALDEVFALAKSENMQKEFRYGGSLLEAHKIFEAGQYRMALKIILKCISDRPLSPMGYAYMTRKLFKLFLRLEEKK